MKLYNAVAVIPKVLFLLVLAGIASAVLFGCAPAPVCSDASYGMEEFGFLRGILHGLVFPVALVAKLFGVDTGLYALNNSGFFYWLGFLLGFGPLGIGMFRFGKK